MLSSAMGGAFLVGALLVGTQAGAPLLATSEGPEAAGPEAPASRTSAEAPTRTAALPGSLGDLPIGETLSGAGALARPAATGLVGRVLAGVSEGPAPLASARVYLYQLADSSLRQAITDERGRFRFSELPAGLYKVIALKGGFAPSVAMVTRSRGDSRQFLELQLAESSGDPADGDDFWAIRDQVPSDILREMFPTDLPTAPRSGDRRAAMDEADAPSLGAAYLGPTRSRDFSAEVAAMTGVEQLPTAGRAVITGGQVDFEGTMGLTRVGITGDYWTLGPDATDPIAVEGAAAGRSREVALVVERGTGSQVSVQSRDRQLLGEGQAPLRLESHRASWVQEFGSSQVRVAGDYVHQANYYSAGPLDPQGIPDHSTSWTLEGAYSRAVDDRISFQTGLRFRDREIRQLSGGGPDLDHPLEDERMDLFGRAGLRVKPTVLVEYGLYTTLRDGSLSLVPQGGLVLQLSDQWQASAVVSQRLDTLEPLEGRRDFTPVVHGESSACSQGEQSCYKVLLKRDLGGGEAFSVGAVHREMGETLRMFFDDDLFSHLESLYLVRGDDLPELQASFSRYLAPQVLTRLDASLGSGGGGVFYATDQEPYENSVRYLVTSLDTQFQDSATGVFVSFHHLEQRLAPLGEALEMDQTSRDPQLELQRLQLMLTQDLNLLMDLAADWAVKLDMEVSRGHLLFGPNAEEDEIRRKVLGGFAVRF